MFLMFRKQVLCVPLVPSLNVLGHTSLNKLDVWNRHLPSRYLCPDSVCLHGPSQCRLNKQSFVVQLLSYVQIFATPWTAALQAPLSSTISWSLLKSMSKGHWGSQDLHRRGYGPDARVATLPLPPHLSLALRRWESVKSLGLNIELEGSTHSHPHWCLMYLSHKRLFIDFYTKSTPNKCYF